MGVIILAGNCAVMFPAMFPRIAPPIILPALGLSLSWGGGVNLAFEPVFLRVLYNLSPKSQ